MPEFLHHRIEVARLERALARLPRLDRAAFLCKARDGLTYAEIAARLGLTDEKAEAHVVRALLKLDADLARSARAWWRFW